MTYLYVLIDPRTVEIRYVGKTINPKARYKGHLYDQSKTHRGAWLRALRRFGLKPVMSILETTDNIKEAVTREQELIRDYRNDGFDLVNATDGGEGMPGFRHTAKAKRKMRKAALGRKASDETRRKIGEASRGRKCSVETRQKQREAMMGRQRTAEHCANIRKAKLGKKRGSPSKEWRAKISAALTGRKRKPFTAEHRRKISEARKRQSTSRETIEAMAAANRGHSHSAEVREKIRQAHFGMTHIVTEETKRKMSISQSRLHQDPTYRCHLSAGMMGRAVSIETREKLRQAALHREALKRVERVRVAS